MHRTRSGPPPLRRRLVAGAAATATASAGVLIAVTPAQAISPDIVISEVYGAGGNGGAILANDFIELFNRGTTAVDVSTWSVQYASAGGTSYSNKTNLFGTIQPGDTYLIQEASGGSNGAPLPTPDLTGSINMSGTTGKLALVTNQTVLTCGLDCDMAPGVRDFVGFGSSANDYEGSGPTPTLSPTTSASRDAAGTDTDNNAADFTTGTPTPDGASEPPPTAEELDIAEIQGTGHLSDDEGDTVETTGVVTAVSGNGYWLQDPTGDGNPLTSEGIFVFTGAGGTKPAVGNGLTVTGTVDEFRPGSATGPGLNITELTSSTFMVSTPSVPLPPPVVIGDGGVQAPPDTIDNDSVTRIDIEVNGTYNPTEDAIDFYELYEGMLIQLASATAVGPTNDFGEIVVLPPSTDDGYVRSTNGGVVYDSYGSPNARRLVLDDVIIGAGNMPTVNTGAELAGPIVGPLDYGFNNYRVYPKAVPTVASDTTERESTKAARAPQLAVATFNVENLDPTDDPSKFADLASIVVDNLKSPDIVTLEEVQDNSGATNDGTVAADATLDQFVAAIVTAGGPTYGYSLVDPVDGADGGEPGGNIRVAFLYREDRGLRFIERGAADATTATAVTTDNRGRPRLTLSPGRIDPANTVFANSRKPLAGEFRWMGEKVFVIANHFNSKGADEPLFGRYQPPTRSSEVQRNGQAAVVNEFVQDVLDVDPNANIVVAGDINDFQFSATIDILTDQGQDLIDLIKLLPPSEQYTYVFDGNSQVLDHLLVSDGLLPAGDPALLPINRSYDVVHVNADFADQASDHDPQVVRLRPQNTP